MLAAPSPTRCGELDHGVLRVRLGGARDAVGEALEIVRQIIREIDRYVLDVGRAGLWGRAATSAGSGQMLRPVTVAERLFSAPRIRLAIAPRGG